VRLRTVHEQAHAVLRKYQKVRTVLLADWGALWHVEVRPADLRYWIAVQYMYGGDLGTCILRPSLRVTVLSPVPARRAAAPDEPLPHVFTEGPPAELCLYDPGVQAGQSEWNETMLIADTIIPWASEWLYFYELWHATGVWHGREVRH
jgi:hypothetical protein